MSGTAEFVTTTGEELLARIAVAHARFADAAAAAPPDLAVDGAWGVRDVVAHLVNVIDRYVAYRPERISSTARGVDDINARELDELAGVGTVELLDQLTAQLDVLALRWGVVPLDQQVPFHGGTTIDVQAVLTNAMGEFLVHGLDIANARGKEWLIDDRDGDLLLGFGTQILPCYVKPTNVGSVCARIEVAGCPPWLMAVDGATCASHLANVDDAFDVVLGGRASDIVLAFYGRVVPDEADARSFFERFERP
jgi:hypothetical protein